MRWLIATSIRLKGLVLAAAAGLLLLGGVLAFDAPVDALPEFKPTIVEVQTEALGLSAEEVEQFITVPLEQDLLNGVAFLQDIESASLPGLSSVVMTFEPGTDLLDARQVVAERLTQAVGAAGLPHVANPPQMLQPLSSTNRVALVRLTPQTMTAIQSSVLARWVIGPRLLGVEGVANVSIFGQRERQIQVIVDPERLAASGVGLSDVIRTTGNALEVSPLTFLEASKPGTGGFIDTLNQRFQVFHEQAIKTADELRRIPLEDETGRTIVADGLPLSLGQVTEVVEGHQPLIGDAICSGSECQLLVVEKFPGANTVEVAAGIETALAAMRPGLEGLEIDTSTYRPAEYVTTAVTNLRTAALVGAFLLLSALVALMMDWRRVLLASLVLAVSLSASAAVLLLMGQTLNVMVLAGLVLGLLVVIDDAVMDTDQLSRSVRVPDAEGRVPLARRVRDSLLELRSAMLYAALIAAVAVVPVLFMQDVAGAFLPPVLLTYLLVMAMAFVVASTVTPAIAAIVLDGARSPRAVRALHSFYDRRLASRIALPTLAIVATAALVAGGIVAAATLRPALEPELQERDVVVEVEAAPGTSLLNMTETTSTLVQALRTVPGVRSVGAHVGRAITSDQVINVNRSEIWVNIDRSADHTTTVSAIREVARGAEGVSTHVTSHSQQQVDEVLGRQRQDIVVRVYGENPSILAAKASEIEAVMARIDGIVDLQTDTPPEEQAIKVRADLTASQAVGLAPGDIRRQTAILLNGITVGNLFDEQKVFDVVVWGTPELRRGTSPLQEVLIETDGFGLVRLGSVADVAFEPSPTEIRHESVFTYLDVVANTSGRSAQAVAADVDAALGGIAFPLEHHAELLGDFSERASQRWLMTGLWVAAALFVFLLLQAATNSWKVAGALLPGLAVAPAGVLIAVALTGGELTIGATAAMFAAFGLAVRQSLSTVRHYHFLHREEGIPFDRDLVIRGTRDRLHAVVTSVAGSAVFLVPLIIRGRSIGFEVVQPMAVGMVGGLIGAAVLALGVVPYIYNAFADQEDTSIWGQELFDLTLTNIEPEAIQRGDR